ncbi:MAG: N-acetylornithine carbamoyltransferase [Armatimonadetes bacterium]|nr:N-acetylornithine carbamoyltransferase [Armatimonadota bacterium]
MKNFVSFLDHSPEFVRQIVEDGLAIKKGAKVPKNILGKTLGMMFFNPSLRTRVSFELAMKQFGGEAISLSANGDVWNLEFGEGAVMNGATVEHVKDAAKVLSRYVDGLAIRSFGELKDLTDDLSERVLKSFAKYADIPVVSMESATEHPAQALADMMTIRERHGEDRVKFVLSWAPHVKALPMAVPHSAILAAAHLGLDITIAHPQGFDLAPKFVDYSRNVANQLGGSLSINHSQEDALVGAKVVYAKNWAPSSAYGNPDKLAHMLGEHSDWLMTGDKIAGADTLLHCLPVRRNLEVADSALDNPRSAIYDEAENRLWAQVALLDTIFAP